MSDNTYQPNDDNRICNWSYVREKDLPEAGQKLLRCSQCREVFYVDRAAQQKDWKYHKQTCLPIEKDHQVRHGKDFQSVEEVLTDIQAALQVSGPLPRGRWIVYLFQQLKRMLTLDPELTPERIKTIDVKIFRQTEEFIVRGKSFLPTLWSSPGFCSYFLSEELFLSTELKQRKAAATALGGSFSISPKDLKDYPTSFQNHQELLLEQRKHADRYVCPAFCGCVMSVLFLSIIDPKSFYRDDDSPEILPSARSAAVVKSTMELLTCPFTRCSFVQIESDEGSPDGISWMSRTRHFANTYGFTLLSDNADNPLQRWTHLDKELFPGGTIKAILTAFCYHPSYWRDFDDERRCMVIGACFPPEHSDQKVLQQKAGPWSYLTEQDRIELFEALWEWHLPLSRNTVTGGTMDLKRILSFYIAGPSVTTLLSMEAMVKNSDATQFPGTMEYLVNNALNPLRESVEPSVEEYIKIVEAQYHQREQAGTNTTSKSDEPPLTVISFPEVLIDQVIDYALPSSRMTNEMMAMAQNDAADINSSS